MEEAFLAVENAHYQELQLRLFTYATHHIVQHVSLNLSQQRYKLARENGCVMLALLHTNLTLVPFQYPGPTIPKKNDTLCTETSAHWNAQKRILSG